MGDGTLREANETYHTLSGIFFFLLLYSNIAIIKKSRRLPVSSATIIRKC